MVAWEQAIKEMIDATEHIPFVFLGVKKSRCALNLVQGPTFQRVYCPPRMCDYEALILSEEEIRRHVEYMPLLVKFPNPEIPKLFYYMNDGTEKHDPYF